MELIKIETNEQQEPVVSGRMLHEALEVKTAYKDWMPRMIEYGFVEGVDFSSFLSESTGGRPSTDHILKLDMAKEIAMLQRTEKGKEVRQYFIQVEKDFNSPEKIMSRALVIANATINNLKIENKVKDQQISELQPKASYYDIILQNKDLMSVTLIAKDYGKSAKWLNNILHEQKVHYKQNGVWLLYQKYAEKGYTQTKTHIIDGCNHVKVQTYWTQKGRLFIYDLLKKIGHLPIIEKK